MKKYILLIVFIALAVLVYSSAGLASYKITLKNGSVVYAGHYWEEEGQVLFYTSGGIMGVGKDSVRKIEESEVTVRVLAPPAPKPAEDIAEAEEVTEEKEISSDENPTEEKKAVNNKLMDEFNTLKERYGVMGSLTTDELIGLSKDMTAFRDKVLQSRLGFVYSDQLVDLYSMGDDIEDLIKSRGQ